MSDKKIAIVTGGNKGVGYGACRLLAEDGVLVVLTARDEGQGKKAAKSLRDEGLDVRFHRLDVTDETSAKGLAKYLTNEFGPLRVCQALVPLLQNSPGGRIVNVSSWFGSMADMNGGGYAAYRISKAALNAFTQILADDLRDTNVTVNAVCPGWVRTDMGGAGAPKSWEEGADTPVWLALHPEGGPNKGFFQDRKPHPW